MNLIFVGGFFPEQFYASIISKSKLQLQSAANVFQWAFIKGLEQNLNLPIKLITVPFIGWFPKYYKDLFIKTELFSNNDSKNTGVMVGFINLPLIKNIFKLYNLVAHLNSTLSNLHKNVIIIYSLDLIFLKAALRVKEKFPNTIVCIIITDLPEMNHLPGFKNDVNIFYRIRREYFEKPIIYKLINKIDCFVVLSDSMIEHLKIQHKQWVRIEGLYDTKKEALLNISKQEDLIKTVLYTGSLNYIYGIKELLEAFSLIESTDIELWICGGGSAANLVTTYAKKNKRIQYFGVVDQDKIFELQAKATLLINPRNTIGEYNKYSFPSKTIEYLASGTPTLLYRLPAIPEEYFDYAFTVEDNKIENLAKAIFNICNMDKELLRLKGQIAKEFIIKNKTAKIQTLKMLKMINCLKA